MNIAMGIKKMSSNLDELINRMERLQKTTGSVGVTVEDGIHEPSGMLYTDLHWIHAAGSSANNLPPRNVALVAKISFNGEDILRKGMDKYFSNLNKKGAMKPEDVFKPYLEGLLDYTKNYVFGSTTKLAPNSPYTISLKGKNSPMVDTGQLMDAWKVRINGKVVS